MIKTVHIESYNQRLPDNTILDFLAQQKLMHELYEHTLKTDPLFHFLYEPELIIRIDSEHCLNKTKEFLTNRGVQYRIYDYPFPEPGEQNFGEGKDSIVGQRQDIFLPILHAHSVAAITLNEELRFQYFERLIHTAFNAAGYPHILEGLYLTNLAVMKAGIESVQSQLDTHKSDQH